MINEGGKKERWKVKKKKTKRKRKRNSESWRQKKGKENAMLTVRTCFKLKWVNFRLSVIPSCRLRNSGDSGLMLKGRSFLKGMTGCWEIIFGPRSLWVTAWSERHFSEAPPQQQPPVTVMLRVKHHHHPHVHCHIWITESSRPLIQTHPYLFTCSTAWKKGKGEGKKRWKNQRKLKRNRKDERTLFFYRVYSYCDVRWQLVSQIIKCN